MAEDGKDGKEGFTDDVGRVVSSFCTCFVLVIFFVMIIFLVSNVGLVNGLEEELEALESARALLCKFSREPGTPSTFKTEGSTKVSGKQVSYAWKSVECEVTVYHAEGESDSNSNSVKASVFAGEDKTLAADTNAMCEETLSGEWPNIRLQGDWPRWDSGEVGDTKLGSGWGCGRRQKVDVIMNGDPQVNWNDEDYKCNAKLEDGGEAGCTIDKNGQVRLGTADQQRAQTESNLEDQRSSTSTFIALVCVFAILFLCCFANCVYKISQWSSCANKTIHWNMTKKNPERPAWLEQPK